MIQDIECLRPELNPELLGNPRHFPILGERAVQIPQIGTDDGVSSRIPVNTERSGHKTVRVEPGPVQLPVACIKIASCDGIRPRRVGSEAIMDTVCGGAHGYWGAGEIDISSRELPSANHAAK